MEDKHDLQAFLPSPTVRRYFRCGASQRRSQTTFSMSTSASDESIFFQLSLAGNRKRMGYGTRWLACLPFHSPLMSGGRPNEKRGFSGRWIYIYPRRTGRHDYILISPVRNCICIAGMAAWGSDCSGIPKVMWPIFLGLNNCCGTLHPSCREMGSHIDAMLVWPT